MSSFTRVFLFLALLVVLFFVLPNVINTREKEAYSSETRLRAAQSVPESDTVERSISTYYQRGSLIRTLLGDHYRDIWNVPVKFPVFEPNDWYGGLKTVRVGGGQQTISIVMMSAEGQSYTLRSVDKDQSRALPPWLFYSLARPLFRDQTSALNPYGAPVVASLADKADLLHTNPVLFYVPYSSTLNESFRKTASGRIMLLEEEPDMTWSQSTGFDEADKIIDSGEMLNALQNKLIFIDSLEFARCRLFDILIGDWDRHAKQWAWAVDGKTGHTRPIPMDRDMAFYKFNDGWINQLAEKVAPKLQTYDTLLENVSGYLRNGRQLDTLLLKNLSQEQWNHEVQQLDSLLTIDDVVKAFKKYPQPVYSKLGKEHESIFLWRKNHLQTIANFFYQNINNPE